MNILSEINRINKLTENIDKLVYQDNITEYPIPSIIDIEWKNILSKPSLNSSKKTYSELLEVYRKSQERSSTQIEIVKKIDINPNFFLFELLKKLNLKFPFDIFEEMYSLIKPVLMNTKNLFNRARPYQLDKLYDLDIDVMITSTHHTPSYPSGHTLYTRLGCNIIKKQYPNLKNELNKIVDITANARIIQGVHYRSDNEASIVLADYLYNYLQKKLYK